MDEVWRNGVLRALDALARGAEEARNDLVWKRGAAFVAGAHEAARRMDELAYRVRCEVNSLFCEARGLMEAKLRCIRSGGR